MEDHRAFEVATWIPVATGAVGTANTVERRFRVAITLTQEETDRVVALDLADLATSQLPTGEDIKGFRVLCKTRRETVRRDSLLVSESCPNLLG